MVLRDQSDWKWWNMSHGEPVLLKVYSGKADELVPPSKPSLPERNRGSLRGEGRHSA